MNTTTYPATVQDLISSAIEQGITPSELLATLPTAPAGFTMDEPGFMSGDDRTWSGPVFEGPKWKVTSHWTIEEGVTFYVDGDGDNAIRGVEAGKIAAALAEVARMTA